MSFMLRQGWHCQFLEEDLKTPLPRKVVLNDKQDLVSMAERDGCSFSLEARQAIGPDGNVGFQGLLGQEIEVDFVVAILKEDGLAPVATLSDMVRKPRNHDTSKSSHVRTIAPWGIGIMSPYSSKASEGPRAPSLCLEKVTGTGATRQTIYSYSIGRWPGHQP